MKNQLLSVIIALLILLACEAPQQNNFEVLYNTITDKDYFHAQQLFEKEKTALSKSQVLFVEALLSNAFHQTATSLEKIDTLLDETQTPLPDSLMLLVYRIKADNHIKRYQYQNAYDTFAYSLSTYNTLLSEDEKEDYENQMLLWKSLAEVSEQRVKVTSPSTIPMLRDKAGLQNLNISAHKGTVPFIFDTGANLSVVTKSVAEKFQMEVFPDTIAVNAITGQKVMAHPAVCKRLYMGDVEIENAVFLVFDDAQLAFPQIEYQIHGILGFPVIAALGQISITETDTFMISHSNSIPADAIPMAMDGLTPLIQLENMHFTFDTGADHSLLYARYYEAHQGMIESSYPETQVQFGGAGGSGVFSGYKIQKSMTVSGKTMVWDSIPVLKSKIKPDEVVYGNLGRDLIQKFDTLTLNFDKMFVRLH